MASFACAKSARAVVSQFLAFQPPRFYDHCDGPEALSLNDWTEPVKFCIRDDDTNFFTSPDDLEDAYEEISQWGPVSLAVVPFHRAGNSKGIPAKFHGQWTTHPLHENENLVAYLREGVTQGRFEIMLHGYHHDEPSGGEEFVVGSDLARKALEGRRYLEDILDTRVRVFVPPRNAIGRDGLRAIVKAGLHLGGTAGVRNGWPLLSRATWKNWMKRTTLLPRLLLRRERTS